jgi:hypothetical protein
VSRLAAAIFPTRYAAGPAGLISAEDDLERLVVQHDAYARQPNITAVWQGYIDQKAGDVASQEAVVARLRAQMAKGSGA